MADAPKPGFTAEQLNASKLSKKGGISNTGGFKYEINNFSYPLQTSVSKDLQHYVGFYINIRGKSKYKKNYVTTEISGTDENRLDRAKLGSRFNALAGAAGAYFGAKMGNTVSNKILGNLGQTSTLAKTITKTVGAVAGGVVGAKAATLFEADKTYRINTAVILAINSAPNAHYSVDYTTQDMGAGAGYLAGGSSAADSSMMGLNMEMARSLMLETAKIPASMAAAFGSNFDPGAIASAGTGTTPNPFREQLFKAVDNRTFTFNYKFVSRSAAEAKNVRSIIDRFKFHMHPEISAGGLFYIYPSEFNIVYYYAGKENPHLNKISTCVLEDMNVDYGGSNGFNTFNDGMPSEINITLRFKELETLTKERIDKGY